MVNLPPKIREMHVYFRDGGSANLDTFFTLPILREIIVGGARICGSGLTGLIAEMS